MRLLILAIFLTSCGGIEGVTKPKEEELTQEQKPLEQTRATIPVKATTEVNVNVDVAVVNVTDEVENREIVYLPARRGFYGAYSYAPAGYRLASRSELVNLYEGGYLKSFKAHEIVWTDSDGSGSNQKWTFNLDSGGSYQYDVMVSLPAIYIQE